MRTTVAWRAFVCVMAIASALLCVCPHVSADDDLDVYTQESAVAKHALLIGVEKYAHAPRVANAATDASGIGSRLKNMGFAVRTVTAESETNRVGLLNAISDHLKTLHADDISVIFFAGHGFEFGSANYLVPSDATNSDALHVTTENIPVPLLVQELEKRRPGLSLIVLDACRTNPFAIADENGRALEVPSGLGAMEAPLSTMIAFAAAPGKPAYSGALGAKDSYYSDALLNDIAQADITLETLFKRVRLDVLNATDMKQRPWENSSLLGDFYFAPGDNVKAVQRDAWLDVLQHQPTITLVGQYIAVFPGSPYTSAARRWLSDHEQSAGPPTNAAANAWFADAHATAFVSGALESPPLQIARPNNALSRVGSEAIATRSEYLFDAPKEDAKIIGAIKVGEFLAVTGERDVDGWVGVSGPNSTKAFIPGVRLVSPPALTELFGQKPVVLQVSGQSERELVESLSSTHAKAIADAKSTGSHIVIDMEHQQARSPGVENQLAFVKYLKVRAALLSMGLSRDQISGSLPQERVAATSEPDMVTVKVYQE
jgi:hypothetical protein